MYLVLDWSKTCHGLRLQNFPVTNITFSEKMAAGNWLKKMNVPLLGQIPLVQSICEGSDNGQPVALGDSVTGNAFMALAEELVKRISERNKEQKPTVKT